jgi:hypothetical protein
MFPQLILIFIENNLHLATILKSNRLTHWKLRRSAYAGWRASKRVCDYRHAQSNFLEVTMNALLSTIAAKTTGYKMLLAGAVAASALAIGSTAHAAIRVGFGFNFGLPVVVSAPVYAPPPVYYQPAPVYAPAPSCPQPAYTAPVYAPPVYTPAPVYTAPAYCPPPAPVFRPAYQPIFRPIYRPVFRPAFHPIFHPFFRGGWHGNRWNGDRGFNQWHGGRGGQHWGDRDGGHGFRGGWGHR